jgi:TP901 family phage tail tape measure protein
MADEIKIQLNLDKGALSSEIKKAEKEIEKLTNISKKFIENSGLDKIGDSFTYLTARVNESRKSIERFNNSLITTAQIYKEVIRKSVEFKGASDSIAKSVSEINKETAKIRRSNVQEVASDLKKLSAIVKTEKPEVGIANIAQSSEIASGALGKFRGAFGSLIPQMTIANLASRAVESAIRLITNVLTTGLNSARDYSRAFAEVNSILADNEQITATQTDVFKDFASQYASTSAQQAKAYYEIVSAGIQGTTNRLDLLKTANDASIAGLSDLKDTTKVLASVLNSYSQQGLTAQVASDALFVAVREGIVTFQEFSDFLGNVAPIASSAGVSFTDLAGTIAFVTKQGVASDIAIRGIRQLLVNVIKPTKEASDTAKALGLEFNQTALQAKGLVGFLQDVQNKTKGNSSALNALVGDVNALVPLLSIVKGDTKDFARILQLTENSAGATARAFNTISQSLDFKISQFTAEFKLLGQEFTESILPALMDTIEAGRGFLRFIKDAKEAKGAFDPQTASLRQLDSQISKLVDSQQIVISQIQQLEKLNRRNDLSVSIKSIDTLRKENQKYEDQISSLLNKRKEILSSQEKERESTRKVASAYVDSNNQIITSEQKKIDYLSQIGIMSNELNLQNLNKRREAIDEANKQGLLSQASYNALILENDRMFQEQRDALREKELGDVTVFATGIAEAFEIASRRSRATIVQLATTIQTVFVSGLSRSLNNVGVALAKNENAFKAFEAGILATFGDIASAIGDFYIKQGVAETIATKGASGWALISAGAGIKILGGYLSAKAGATSANTPSSSGGTGSYGGSELGGSRASITPDQIEERKPSTNVSLVVQGDILDSQETGTRLAKILSDSFGKEGIVLTDARFA